jgi:hypothetical protein
MPDDILPVAGSPEAATPAPEPDAPAVNRRDIGKNVGRFLVYTAPALLALMTAKDASASP